MLKGLQFTRYAGSFSFWIGKSMVKGDFSILVRIKSDQSSFLLPNRVRVIFPLAFGFEKKILNLGIRLARKKKRQPNGLLYLQTLLLLL